jgi:hypothetical protein
MNLEGAPLERPIILEKECLKSCALDQGYLPTLLVANCIVKDAMVWLLCITYGSRI